MNLRKKKLLVARTLNVGKDRIVFNNKRLDEINKALTRNDILDLVNSKAILVKQIKGRRKVERRKRRRGPGKIRKKIINKKRLYVQLIRRFRAYLKGVLLKGEISKKNYLLLRKEIRTGIFKNLNNLKERIKLIKETNVEEENETSKKKKKGM